MKTKIIIIVFIILLIITIEIIEIHKNSIVPAVAVPSVQKKIDSTLPVISNNTDTENPPPQAAIISEKNDVPKRTSSGLIENFDTNYTIKESNSLSKSKSSEWWLGSGSYFYSRDGIGSTVLGNLSNSDSYRSIYASTNPIDTDDGYHPQNIFRLVTKSKWLNFQQEAYLKITKDNLSTSPNRNASNGLLLFNRYQDEFNLYYTGIRVDGYAVIKKKTNSTYYTMDYEPIIKGPDYDRTTNPDLLPKNTWIGLRSTVTTNTDGTVDIKLYTDISKTGNWTLAAHATDDGKSYGGAIIEKAGYGGIRTDFMDVEFDDYKIVKF